MTTDTPTIEAHQLTKTYDGGVEAVKAIDFQVAAGEVFGLLGPNGAGKSTTVGMFATTIAHALHRPRRCASGLGFVGLAGVIRRSMPGTSHWESTRAEKQD